MLNEGLIIQLENVLPHRSAARNLFKGSSVMKILFSDYLRNLFGLSCFGVEGFGCFYLPSERFDCASFHLFI